jgi:hypothetical protein
MNLTNKPIGVVYGVPGYYPSCYPYAAGCGQCGSCNPGSLVTAQDVVGKEGVPVNGHMPYNTFRIINQKPYLIDNTDMVYGAKLKAAESIYTRVSRTQDLSCINLAATVDMTHDNISNTLWFGNLCDMISAQYKELKGKLPLVKQTVRFRLEYTVFDTNGGNVYQSHVDCFVKNSAMHYTDLKDYFVNSYMGMMIGDIPSLTFQGAYTLRLDTLSMYVDTVHNDEELNPYYAFNEERTKINIEHETVEAAESTETIYCTTEIGWTTQFQANMSTRIRFSFTAFVGDMPWVYNTYPIYQCLNRPIDAIVDELLTTVETLTQEVDELRAKNFELEERVALLENKAYDVVEYHQNTQYIKGQLLYAEVGVLYQASVDFVSDNTAETVAESMVIDIDAGKLVKVGE